MPVTHNSHARTAVWAPRASVVDLVLPGPGGSFDDARRIPMDPDGEWWHGPALDPGTDYGFALDGGPARPDPRSPHQPYGVHGPSRTFDRAFAWTDDSWTGRDVRGDVLYELHIGTFTPAGTLDAAIERLGHLASLGIGTVELMPVAAFAGRWGWGYDGTHPYAVHEPYGGPRALQRFVDAAHAAGLAVALDVVYNHLGPAGNYLPEFGPYFTDAHTTPWGTAMNLDAQGSGEVREWILGNALRWFTDFHVDALRLDAVHELFDDSPVHLLAELSNRVAKLSAQEGRPLTLIAESDRNDPATVTETKAGGLGMSAQWADDVHHAVHALVTGERHGYYVDFGSLDVLRKAMTGVFVHDGGYSTFRGRDWGRPVPDEFDRHRFVAFAQDHDQVGNRALGDRLAARLDAGTLAATAALILLSPYTPMLFMGEEWAATTPWAYFTDHDAELGSAVSEGRRREFAGHGWAQLYGAHVEVPDPQDPATFTTSRLDWAELSASGHARMLAWYRELIGLRASLGPATTRIVAADSTQEGSGHGDAFVVDRATLAIGVNLSDVPRTVRVDRAHTRILATWDPGAALNLDDGARHAEAGLLHLPPRSVAVVGSGTVAR